MLIIEVVPTLSIHGIKDDLKLLQHKRILSKYFLKNLENTLLINERNSHNGIVS